MPPRFLPGDTVPKGLNRDEVVRLLATTEGDRPADLRDRAILMVLITYGLRAGEVAGLLLEDLDWAEERLQVRCPKPGRTHHYPLSRGVGQTILRYIREARPTRPERARFLSLQAPIRPITRARSATLSEAAPIASGLPASAAVPMHSGMAQPSISSTTACR